MNIEYLFKFRFNVEKMKLIAYRLSNKGIKKYKFMLRNAQEDDWESRENGQNKDPLLFKVNRERGNLTPESYFNKNPAGKAKLGNENMYFPAIIIALNYEFV